MSDTVSGRRQRVGALAATGGSARALLAGLCLLGSGCDPMEAADTPDSFPRAPGAACRSAPGGSRWAGEYARSADFGKDPDGWLGGVTGIAATRSGRVAVLDGSSARVVILEDSLRLVREFGRRGRGPGELSASPMLAMQGMSRTFNHLEASDSGVYAFNVDGISVFGWDGRLQRTIGGIPGGALAPFTLRGMYAGESRLMYGFDTLDVGGSGRHRLQTWTIAGDGRRLAAEITLVPPPLTATTFRLGARQARALWTAEGGCVAMSDGGSPWIVRMDAGTERLDSLRLPRHDVPPYDPADDERFSSELGRLSGSLRGRASGARRMPPTQLMRWSEIIIDPDGFLWVRPWRAPSDPPGEVPVLRVSLADGRVEQDRVPAFPQAFGPPGVFYSVEKDGDTDEVVLVMYEKRGARRGGSGGAAAAGPPS